MEMYGEPEVSTLASGFGFDSDDEFNDYCDAMEREAEDCESISAYRVLLEFNHERVIWVRQGQDPLVEAKRQFPDTRDVEFLRDEDAA